jgi:hypothetical protein
MFILSILKSFFKDLYFDITVWTIVNLEEIVGIPVCVITLQTFSLRNEVLKDVGSIITAVTSAYIIHRMKKYWVTKKKK